MAEILIIWAQLAVCLVTIAIAGTVLSRYGDIIGSKTGLSGNWIGLILMATVTSLPELSTGFSAVTIGQAPNIAVGDVLGSCVFNLLLFVVLDAMYRDRPFYAEVSDAHALSAAFGIALICAVGLAIVAAPLLTGLAMGHVGLITPILMAGYGYAMWSVFVREREIANNASGELIDRYPTVTLRIAVIRYAVAALFVVGAGISLPFVGKDLAAAMGWSTSFVGTLFIAAVTSAPELVVTVAAMRIGAIDMAVGNLLGSNLFNMLILALDDVVSLDGPLLERVQPIHANSAFSAAIMSAVVIAALQARARRKFWRVPSLPSLVLLAVYAVNVWALFDAG
jgi:cation:H+ antiporter